MRVGLHIGRFDWPGGPAEIGRKLRQIAITADKMGFYDIMVMDHLFQLGTEFGVAHGPVDAAMLEGYSTISYVAALTRRINVGLGVTCNFFRYPGLLVKIVSTLDVLSQGRAFLGIGAGWFQREAVGLGIPFPPLRERLGRLEETLKIAKQMWTGNFKAFHGKYYQLAEPINSPQPLTKPHPPIMVGGDGETILRLVSKYADASNFVIGAPIDGLGVVNTSWENGLEFVRRKLTALEKHCKEVGRNYDEIEKTVITYLTFSPGSPGAADVIELCRKLGNLGIRRVGFDVPNVGEITPIKILGREVIPRVTDIE